MEGIRDFGSQSGATGQSPVGPENAEASLLHGRSVDAVDGGHSKTEPGLWKGCPACTPRPVPVAQPLEDGKWTVCLQSFFR